MEIIYKEEDIVQLSPHSAYLGGVGEIKVGKPHKVKVIYPEIVPQPIRVHYDKSKNSKPYAVADLLPYK